MCAAEDEYEGFSKEILQRCWDLRGLRYVYSHAIHVIRFSIKLFFLCLVTGRTESVQCKKKKIKEPRSTKVHKVKNWEACKTLCNRDDKCSYFIYRVSIQKKSKHVLNFFLLSQPHLEIKKEKKKRNKKKNVKGKCYKYLTNVENKKALWISGQKNCDLRGIHFNFILKSSKCFA